MHLYSKLFKLAQLKISICTLWYCIVFELNSNIINTNLGSGRSSVASLFRFVYEFGLLGTVSSFKIPWILYAIVTPMNSHSSRRVYGQNKKNINNNNEHNTTEQNQQKGNNIKFV